MIQSIQPIIDLIHIQWMRFWSHRSRYSIYGPSHLDYALKLADIQKRNTK